MKKIELTLRDFTSYVQYHFFGVKIVGGGEIRYRIWALIRIFRVLFFGRKESEGYLYPLDVVVENKFGKFFVPANSDMILTLSTKFEADLIDYFKIKPDSIFLDIGANAGKYSFFVCQNSQNPMIYSFEPSPSTFLGLSRNIELNKNSGIKALNIALSDSKGVLQFANSKTKTGLSHVVQENELIDSTFFELTNVKILPLDDFTETGEIDPLKIDLIKIDVEGHEFEVLKGAESTLKKILPKTRILIETARGTDNSSPLIQFMSGLKFSVKKLNDEYFLLTKN